MANDIETSPVRLLGISYSRPLPRYGLSRVFRGEGEVITVFVGDATRNAPSDVSQLLQERIQATLKQCCVEHSEIVIDDKVHGGMPSIRGTRISVNYVLDRLVAHGSIHAVKKKSFPHLSENQIREAIGYVRDFMEMACVQLEANDR